MDQLLDFQEKEVSYWRLLITKANRNIISLLLYLVGLIFMVTVVGCTPSLDTSTTIPSALTPTVLISEANTPVTSVDAGTPTLSASSTDVPSTATAVPPSPTHTASATEAPDTPTATVASATPTQPATATALPNTPTAIVASATLKPAPTQVPDTPTAVIASATLKPAATMVPDTPTAAVASATLKPVPTEVPDTATVVLASTTLKPAPTQMPDTPIAIAVSPTAFSSPTNAPSTPIPTMLTPTLEPTSESQVSSQQTAPEGLAQGGLPLSEVETVTLPPVDVTEAEQEEPKKGEPLRFAHSISVQFEPATIGTWETLDEQTRLWRLRIVSEGATSLNFGFTSYFMPPGGRLFLYTPDYSTVIGPFTEADNEEHGQLWSPILPSDDIIIELTIPADQLSLLQLKLTTVNHGYR